MKIDSAAEPLRRTRRNARRASTTRPCCCCSGATPGSSMRPSAIEPSEPEGRALVGWRCASSLRAKAFFSPRVFRAPATMRKKSMPWQDEYISAPWYRPPRRGGRQSRRRRSRVPGRRGALSFFPAEATRATSVSFTGTARGSRPSRRQSPSTSPRAGQGSGWRRSSTPPGRHWPTQSAPSRGARRGHPPVKDHVERDIRRAEGRFHRGPGEARAPGDALLTTRTATSRPASTASSPRRPPGASPSALVPG